MRIKSVKERSVREGGGEWKREKRGNREKKGNREDRGNRENRGTERTGGTGEQREQMEKLAAFFWVQDLTKTNVDQQRPTEMVGFDGLEHTDILSHQCAGKRPTETNGA